MQIDIRTKDFALTNGIRARIERRLGFALDRFEREIHTVAVWVGDVNGPKGGERDKFCRIAATLRRGTIVLEQREADLYVAIDRAANRLGAKIAREVERVNRPASPRTRVMEQEDVANEGAA